MAAHRQPTGNEVENGGQENQNRLARLIDEENRLLDRGQRLPRVDR